MPSDLQVDNIKDGSATKTLATLSSSAVTLHSDVTFPAGHVIQTKTDTFDPSSDQDATTTADDILGTNLQVTIAPNSTSNKLVVTCFIGNVYTYATTNRSIDAGFKYHADWSGTPATLGSREFITNQHLRHTDATVDMANFYFQTVADAPVTTSIIIRPWFKTNIGNVRLFDNQTMVQASLTVMEIQA